MKRCLFMTSVVVILFSSILWAQKPHMCEKMHKGTREMKHKEMPGKIEKLDELGLTDEQLKSIQNLRLDFIKKTANTKAQLEIKQAELKALWAESEPTKDAILKKIKEISDLKGEIAMSRAEMKLEIYKILTPDQKKKLKEIMRKHLHMKDMME